MTPLNIISSTEPSRASSSSSCDCQCHCLHTPPGSSTTPTEVATLLSSSPWPPNLYNLTSRPKRTYAPPPSEIPWPGSTYIIQQQHPTGPGKVLSAAGNELTLTARNDEDKTTHWTISVSADNWVGLQNVVTRKFIGNTGSNHLAVRAQALKEWEYLEIRLHPDGECYIYNKIWNWKKGMSSTLDLCGQPGKWYFYLVNT